ncbi:MAG: hypothetical protein JXR86_07615 [Spirochaetales bacterium]|nr:hypothetical protein [Spirochaetales bacterium]
MTKNIKLLLATLVFTFFRLGSVYAQEEGNEEEKPQQVDLYSLGDQNFAIHAGMFFPLFFFDPTPADGESAFAATKLTVGGAGSLMYEAYLNNNFKIGLEIGGIFAYSPNENPFFMVPITTRIAYEFHFGQFSLPLFWGMGINIITYQDEKNVQFLMKPGASLYWHFNSDWSFGGTLSYWVSPEIVPSDHSYDRIGNFLDFTLSARYHF